MAAPMLNQFWKVRSKSGRDTIFADPKDMWNQACCYFDWCDNNPWKKQDFVSGGANAGEIVELETARPYTIQGLCNFWGVNTTYFRQFKAQITEGKHKDFSSIILQIEDIIYQQKFEGAAVGAFNANIISRDLGLIDKQQNELNANLNVAPQIKVYSNAPSLANSENDVEKKQIASRDNFIQPGAIEDAQIIYETSQQQGSTGDNK